METLHEHIENLFDTINPNQVWLKSPCLASKP